jgi:hypothetical protein
MLYKRSFSQGIPIGMQKASSRPGLPKVHAFGMGLFIITLNTYRGRSPFLYFTGACPYGYGQAPVKYN